MPVDVSAYISFIGIHTLVLCLCIGSFANDDARYQNNVVCLPCQKMLIAFEARYEKSPKIMFSVYSKCQMQSEFEEERYCAERTQARIKGSGVLMSVISTLRA